MENNQLNEKSLLLDGVDPDIRPQDDLFGYVNGQWLKDSEIPEDRAASGSFYDLYDQAELAVRQIIEDCADGKIDDADAERIGKYYRAFMDTETVEALGVEPIQPHLARIRETTSKTDLVRFMAREAWFGYDGLFGFKVRIDKNNPERYSVYFMQAGIALPDESYYQDEDKAEIREKYVAHIERMFKLILPNIDAAQAAQKIMAFETEVAKLHWDRVRCRDSQATNNPMTFEELVALAPDFPWTEWREALDAPAELLNEFIVSQPSFYEDGAKLWAQTDLETLQLWMQWHQMIDYASDLCDAVSAEHFDFWGRTLTGSPTQRERWKRGVSHVESALGEAVGRLYVQRHFPPANKAKMEKLVENLIAAYHDSISDLEWMGPDTRQRALEKLGTFYPKIGYPNKWRDYSAMNLDVPNLLEMGRQATKVEVDYQFGKAGKKVDRDEWLMTPQTVNAYYLPTSNEIVFPAAILQPPFFDPEGADAINYAAIGAVIGHEIGHGFDDQGSQYDGTGALKDWWTETDRKEFEARTKKLIDQFENCSPRQLDDTFHVNGELTIGENIGDLGGLSIAWKAWLLALKQRGVESPEAAEDIEGVPAAKAFFYSWARIWRGKQRDELAKQLLTIDPHSPSEFRCNTIAANLDEFARVFNVKEGDHLWLDPEDRVSIW
ncbi:peptidase M13 [Boudabousia liubingyangii]|uniref:Peptidase M13 n=1 Tax=Boudabousia liubingyangii TaxID=1921764 RepID=A0A1Q5PMP4_9ACTO|nr:M13-type metalloendopeptidase [Boudabousia liubingyangii]OKL47431.1 peptidase M13 [Boudabousia liubingyangii]OKL48802.1 peptidase M13 [Boudabousia liubingyangii]